MKRLMIGMLIIVAAFSMAYAQQDAEEKKPSEEIDAYEFPLTSKSPKWKTLKTYKEKLLVLQIPDQVLNEMSTEGLVRTCLNYPMWLHMMLHGNLQSGIEKVISNFNGLQELMKRTDAGSILIKVYKDIDSGAFQQDWTSRQRGGFTLHLSYVEMLLSQEQILSSLTKKEKCSLLEDCILKYKSKLKHEVYGITGLKTVTIVICQILLGEDYKPFKQKYEENERINLFLRDETPIDVEIFNEIILYAQQYLVENE